MFLNINHKICEWKNVHLGTFFKSRKWESRLTSNVNGQILMNLTGLPFIFKKPSRNFFLGWLRRIFLLSLQLLSYGHISAQQRDTVESECVWMANGSHSLQISALLTRYSFVQTLSSPWILHCQMVVGTPHILELLWGLPENFSIKNRKHI